jgi:hypothetical protein
MIDSLPLPSPASALSGAKTSAADLSVVVRHDGRTDQLEGRIAAEPTIEEYERKNWLKCG